MRVLLALAAFGMVATPLAAQPNPFKLSRAKLRSVQVEYTLGGEVTGTGVSAMSGDQFMTRSVSTGKFFGKESTTESWTLTTPEWIYSGDIREGKGHKMANPLRAMAEEYDKLSRDEKKRAYQNLQDLAEVMAMSFGVGLRGDKGQKRTIAGEECEETTFGSFSNCAMTRAPEVSLASSGRMLCIRFEQTATSVTIDQPVDPALFEVPEGMTFTTTDGTRSADSTARGFVRYLASETLSDSLAKSKAEAQAAREKAVADGNLNETQADSLQEAQIQEACETLANLDLGTVMSSAADAVLDALAKAAVEEAKKSAVGKLKGLIRKPELD